MTFSNSRDLREEKTYWQQIKEIAEKRIAWIDGFLGESRERVIKEPRKATGGRRGSGDSKKWRDDPMSEKQLSFMEQNDIDFWDGMSKGEASDSIDSFIKSKKGGR